MPTHPSTIVVAGRRWAFPGRVQLAGAVSVRAGGSVASTRAGNLVRSEAVANWQRGNVANDLQRPKREGCCTCCNYIQRHIAIACFECFRSMFYLCFPDACCNCVIWMLHMFHAYVACVLFECCIWLQLFSSVFQKHVSNVSTAFMRMLQPLLLDVLKVDRVSWAWWALSPVARAQRTQFYFDLFEVAWRVRRTGAASGHRPRAERPGTRLAEVRTVVT
jgi:hypothetical protein